MELCFEHYFDFLGAETEIDKNALNWKNLDGWVALKRQAPTAWLAMSLNHFEFDIIWTAFQPFLELHSQWPIWVIIVDMLLNI